MRRKTFEQTLLTPSHDFQPDDRPTFGISTNNELLGGSVFGRNASSELYYKILLASTDPHQPDTVEDILPYDHDANVNTRGNMHLVGPKLAKLSLSAIHAAESIRTMEARAVQLRAEAVPELVLAFGENWEQAEEARAYVDALTRMEVININNKGFTISGVSFSARDFHAHQ